jgi:hypothetical protein
MKIVKLTFNYDWPIFRQTPEFSQVWGDYKFIIDENLKECDYWIIYTDYQLKKEEVICPPNNVIFIPGECYETSPRFSKKFLNQFGLIITVQKQLKHKNILYSHNANPWFVCKSYDELSQENPPIKNKLISVVSSNKTFTKGHKKRLQFVENLKLHFGDKLDVFGRGINDFEDKWEVLADYKYTIAIENDFVEDWVTEKYFDCIYADSLPFYYGCPNLETYVDKDSFIRIDINDFESSIKIIEDAIETDEYEQRIEFIQNQKIRSLNEDQFFPWISNILQNLEKSGVKRKVHLKLNIGKVSFKILIKRKFKYFLRIIKNGVNKY